MSKIINEATEFTEKQRQVYADSILPIFSKDEELENTDVQTSRFSKDQDFYDEYYIEVRDQDFDANKKYNNFYNNTAENLTGISRQMAWHPIIEECLSHICDEAICFTKNNPEEDPVRLVSNREKMMKRFGYTEPQAIALQDEIGKQFDKVLSLFNFTAQAWNYFFQWYVDGVIHFELVFYKDPTKTKGIKELRYISPFNIIKIKLRKKDGTSKYYYLYDSTKEKELLQKYRANTYSDNSYAYNILDYLPGGKKSTKQQRLIDAKYVVAVESGLKDVNGYPKSHLLFARKYLNQFVMLQDALVTYRVARSPERRLIYVDVGKSQQGKVRQIITDVLRNFKQKLIFDIQTGEALDQRRHLAPTEDVVIPRYSNGNTTEIDTMPGPQNMNQMADVDMFERATYRAMKVPLSRFFDEDAVVSLGKDQSISRDEFTFSKFIHRVRDQFNQLLYEVLKRQMISLGILNSPSEYEVLKQCFSIYYDGDNYYDKMKELELVQYKTNLFQQIGPEIEEDRLSQTWAYQFIWGFTKEDIDEIQVQRVEELQKQVDLKGKTLELRRTLAAIEGELDMLRDPANHVEYPEEENTGEEQ